MNELEVKVTRYNVTTLIGWGAIVFGLVGAGLQFFFPSMPGIVFLAVGLIGGAITVSFSGPMRTVTVHHLRVK
jgi:hypothetical protein